jgi:protoporphyrin/coproporphyrin ferrochelatase
MTRKILLVNYGGPKKLDEVPAFLSNLMGREISGPMLQGALDRYGAIGGGSPLCETTSRLAALLSKKLPEDISIDSAFRYSSPSIEDQIDQCRASGVESIIFLVLSPFYSSRTVGSYIEAVDDYLCRASYRPVVRFIHSWCNEPTFIDAWVRKIEEEVVDKGTLFIFTAHSLPQSLSKEPYRQQIIETVGIIAARLGLLSNYCLAWQSVPRGAAEPWIGPSFEETINAVSAENFPQLVVVPIGFLNDHLETLYDIDIEYRRLAVSRGFQFVRVSSFNTYAPFVEALGNIIKRELVVVHA